MTEIDLNVLSTKVRNGSYKLVAHTSAKSKGKTFSSCWTKVKDIIDSDGKAVFGIACCSNCYSCFSYKKTRGQKNHSFWYEKFK